MKQLKHDIWDTLTDAPEAIKKIFVLALVKLPIPAPLWFEAINTHPEYFEDVQEEPITFNFDSNPLEEFWNKRKIITL